MALRALTGILLVLALALTLSAALFLYALVPGGTWHPFVWAAALSLALLTTIKLVSVANLGDEEQLLVSAMLWEVVGFVSGWTWVALALAAFGVLFLTTDGRPFLICLAASAGCKLLTRHSMTMQEATAFKMALVEQGLTKEEARRAWIAEARERRKRSGRREND